MCAFHACSSADARADLAKRLLARVARRRAELVLNSQETIVLRDAIRAGRRAGLDLPGVRGNRDIRNRRVLRFAGAMRRNRRIPRALRHLNGFQRFRQRANLVHLDQNRVRVPFRNAAREALGVGHEQVVGRAESCRRARD